MPAKNKKTKRAIPILLFPRILKGIIAQIANPATGEKGGSVGDVSYPSDLVHLTDERFSFGVSSPSPSKGAKARGDGT